MKDLILLFTPEIYLNTQDAPTRALLNSPERYSEIKRVKDSNLRHSR